MSVTIICNESRSQAQNAEGEDKECPNPATKIHKHQFFFKIKFFPFPPSLPAPPYLYSIVMVFIYALIFMKQYLFDIKGNSLYVYLK